MYVQRFSIKSEAKLEELKDRVGDSGRFYPFDKAQDKGQMYTLFKTANTFACTTNALILKEITANSFARAAFLHS